MEQAPGDGARDQYQEGGITMLLFLIGMSVGTCLGAVAMAILVSAKRTRGATSQAETSDSSDEETSDAPGDQPPKRSFISHGPSGRAWT